MPAPAIPPRVLARYLVARGRVPLAVAARYRRAAGAGFARQLVEDGHLDGGHLVRAFEVLAADPIRCRCGAEQMRRLLLAQRPTGGCPACLGATRIAPRKGLAEDLAALTEVDGHVITGELGRGGMGVVLRARDPLGRDVALKLLTVDEPDAALRLQREAQAASRLTHPGIVRIHRVARAALPGRAPVPYIVMDLVEGVDLDDAAAHADIRERAELLLEVARAVGHAHAQGVVHRDLKPANVRVRDEDGRVVVVDFGLARTGGDVDRLTATGVVVGTPEYMAPEQIRGEVARVLPPTDVWSLGVMLYELLCDRRPFAGETLGALYSTILMSAPRPPEAGRDPLRAALGRVALRALERQPALRYADAAALADDLARALAGVRLRRRSPIDWVRRHPWRANGLMLLLAVLAIVGARTMRARRRAAAFDRWRAAAVAAHDAGRWDDVIARAEQALRLGRDPQLERLVEHARGRRTGAQAARDEASWRAALAPRLQQIAREIEEARAAFYIPSEDIRARLDALRRGLDRLEPTARDPRGAGHAQLRSLLGAGLLLCQRPGRAQPHLEAALALRPDDGWVAHELGRLWLERALASQFQSYTRLGPRPARPGDEAARMAQRYLARAAGGWTGGRPVDRLVARALCALAVRDSRPALMALCEQGLAEHAGEVGVEALWRIQALATGDLALQVDRTTRVLERRPHDVWATFLRALTHRRAGRLPAAMEDLDRTLAIDPTFELALNNRGVLFDEARDYRRAVADFDLGLRHHPRSLVLRLNRASTRLVMGAPEGALADARRAIRDWPQAVRARLALVVLLSDLKRNAEAVEAARALIALDPTGVDGHYFAGVCLLRLGKTAEGQAAIERAVACDPDHVEARVARGILRAERGDWDGLAVEAAHLQRIAPEHGATQLLVGWLLLARQRPREALPVLDRVCALASRDARAHRIRCQVHMRLTDWAAAERDATTAIALGDVASLPLRALCRLKQRNYAGAVADSEAAHEAGDTRFETDYNGGVSLMRLKRYDEALIWLRRARSQAPPAMRERVERVLAAVAKRAGTR